MKSFSVFVILAILALVAASTPGGPDLCAPGAKGCGNANKNHKITICHRTNSITNPYVVITVDQSAANGISGDDKNAKSDHYGVPSHQGPVFNPTIHIKSSMDWGDIIPPIPGVHDGRNWNVEGQAIYNNGCKLDRPEDAGNGKGCHVPTKPCSCPTVGAPSGTPTAGTAPTAGSGDNNGDPTRRLLQNGNGKKAPTDVTAPTPAPTNDPNTPDPTPGTGQNPDGPDLVAPGANGGGNPKGNNFHKITICHRTNSITNPYVVITVDQDAADGDLQNDNGRGDHFMIHVGPVFDPAVHTKSSMNWGDIIPPIPGIHMGRNWTPAGQVIYNNGCDLVIPGQPPKFGDEGGGGMCWWCDCEQPEIPVVPVPPPGTPTPAGAVPPPVGGIAPPEDPNADVVVVVTPGVLRPPPAPGAGVPGAAAQVVGVVAEAPPADEDSNAGAIAGGVLGAVALAGGLALLHKRRSAGKLAGAEPQSMRMSEADGYSVSVPPAGSAPHAQSSSPFGETGSAAAPPTGMSPAAAPMANSGSPFADSGGASAGAPPAGSTAFPAGANKTFSGSEMGGGPGMKSAYGAGMGGGGGGGSQAAYGAGMGGGGGGSMEASGQFSAGAHPGQAAGANAGANGAPMQSNAADAAEYKDMLKFLHRQNVD